MLRKQKHVPLQSTTPFACALTLSSFLRGACLIPWPSLPPHFHLPVFVAFFKCISLEDRNLLK